MHITTGPRGVLSTRTFTLPVLDLGPHSQPYNKKLTDTQRIQWLPGAGQYHGRPSPSHLGDRHSDKVSIYIFHSPAQSRKIAGKRLLDKKIPCNGFSAEEKKHMKPCCLDCPERHFNGNNQTLLLSWIEGRVTMRDIKYLTG